MGSCKYITFKMYFMGRTFMSDECTNNDFIQINFCIILNVIYKYVWLFFPFKKKDVYFQLILKAKA